MFNPNPDEDELSPENYPKGATILREDFYWDCTDDNSPVGNDTGSDTFYAFLNWRSDHPRSSPIKFLKELLADWEVIYSPGEAIDNAELGQILSDDRAYSLLTHDDAVIGLAFSQIILTGKVEAKLNEFAVVAIDRQLLLEVLSARLGTSFSQERIEKLAKMKAVLEGINQG